MSTVGYGDIVPKSDAARLFTASLIVMGITVFAASLSVVIGPLVGGNLKRIMQGRFAKVNRKEYLVILGASPVAVNDARHLHKIQRVQPDVLLALKDLTMPLYLLAGEADDITTREQVFNAEALVGTPRDQVAKKLVPGGHIGLFMGARTLAETWPEIGRWIASH